MKKEQRKNKRNQPVRVLLAAGVLLLAGLLPVMAGRGFVDPEPFLELGGEEDLSLEISLSGALLKLISSGIRGSDPDLADTVAGLHSIHAVILELDSEKKIARGVELAGRIEKSLRKGKWERIARVKDEEGRVSVWILSDEERVDGVTVLIQSIEDGEMVFVNIDGSIDLSKLEALGEDLDIPGLDQINRNPGD